MYVKTLENRARRLAAKCGYRLQKIRAIRWEGRQWTPVYRIIDIGNSLPVAECDDLEEVMVWLTA